jgi:hypothetical protein
MSRSKHPFWRAFDKVERTIGEPLEEIVASRKYLDVMLTGRKVQRAVGGVVGRVARGAVEGVLHVAQIPTRSDVDDMNRKLTRLSTEIRALSAETQEKPAPSARHQRPATAEDRQDEETSDGD